MALLFSNLVKDPQSRKCSFDIENIHVGLLNAVRRVILSEIPNVAISFDAYHKDLNDCNFIVNTTSLHNEFLGHRLSMIPIHLNQNSIKDFEPSRYRFEINMHNTLTESIVVTTEHIKVYDENNKLLSDEETRKMFPPDPITHNFIIITKLKPNLYDPQCGEHLHVEFKARKGTAKMNAAWSPVSLCSYAFVIDPIAAAAALEQKLANVQDDEEKTALKRSFETLDIQRYYHRNTNGEPCKFRFALESECALSPTWLFDKALDVLISKLNSLVNEKGKFEQFTVNEEQHLYALKVFNEDHTLGNLLQVLIYEYFIKEKNGITYAGYNVPHPLEENFILKIRFDKKTSIEHFVQKVVDKGTSTLTDIQAKWRAFTTDTVPKRRITRNKN